MFDVSLDITTTLPAPALERDACAPDAITKSLSEKTSGTRSRRSTACSGLASRYRHRRRLGRHRRGREPARWSSPVRDCFGYQLWEAYWCAVVVAVAPVAEAAHPPLADRRVPRASVVISAHDEQDRIGRTLATLLADAEPGEFDVLVVCNGCCDRTAEIVHAAPGVRVVELERPSKIAALREGTG